MNSYTEIKVEQKILFDSAVFHVQGQASMAVTNVTVRVNTHTHTHTHTHVYIYMYAYYFFSLMVARSKRQHTEDST